MKKIISDKQKKQKTYLFRAWIPKKSKLKIPVRFYSSSSDTYIKKQDNQLVIVDDDASEIRDVENFFIDQDIDIASLSSMDTLHSLLIEKKLLVKKYQDTLPTIYLAGPDVFFPDSQQRSKKLKQLCLKHGFNDLYPGDNDPSLETADDIRKANMQLIEDTDCLIANLEPFRGFEPDSGSVFELSYALSLGKKVAAYAPSLEPMINRLRKEQNLSDDDLCDKNGCHIENFGLSHNLMYAHLVKGKSAEEAIMFLKKCLTDTKKTS